MKKTAEGRFFVFGGREGMNLREERLMASREEEYMRRMRARGVCADAGGNGR